MIKRGVKELFFLPMTSSKVPLERTYSKIYKSLIADYRENHGVSSGIKKDMFHQPLWHKNVQDEQTGRFRGPTLYAKDDK